jgi:hypothetical protein
LRSMSNPHLPVREASTHQSQGVGSPLADDGFLPGSPMRSRPFRHLSDSKPTGHDSRRAAVAPILRSSSSSAVGQAPNGNPIFEAARRRAAALAGASTMAPPVIDSTAAGPASRTRTEGAAPQNAGDDDTDRLGWRRLPNPPASRAQTLDPTRISQSLPLTTAASVAEVGTTDGRKHRRRRRGSQHPSK